MKLDSQACKEKYISWLTGIPHSWKCTIAEAICSSMSDRLDVDCNQVKECETLTYLSNFTVSGTVVSIKYTDEEGVEVTRSFDFSDILNNSLDGIDPKCIATAEQWASYSFVEKFQAWVDKLCTNCDS